VPRKHDVAFGRNERLWRRVGKGDLLASGKVRPGSLRLQISVVRERHGKREDAPTADRPGVAECVASAVVISGEQFHAVEAVCVDDPLDDTPGHALIAVIAPPGEAVSDADVSALRQQLALQLHVVVPPLS
jgi:hypothetical protein